MSNMLSALKENGEDFEWYPTTPAMIEAVKKRVPNDTMSIMDIGAGDGRVLLSLGEKCSFALLYAIELSPILMQAQPKNIVPLGTDLFQQNLSCLMVDYIFCNPRYSEFEEWVCKIVAEGFAKKAYLVIPKRWKESHRITDALRRRGATATVIHSDDFLNAERQARAVVDVVEVVFPRHDRYSEKVKDPFDIWFDENIDTFDKAEPIMDDYENLRELTRKFSQASIDEMVAEYLEEYKRLEMNYRAIFKLDHQILTELGVDKDAIREGLKTKMAGLKVKYWTVLFDRLDAITSRLATKSKKDLLEKLTRNVAVEFTASNAYSVVIWAIKNANQYFDDQCVGLFYELATFDGALKYKSNVKTWDKTGWRYVDNKHTHFALDYRIVVERWSAIKKEDYRDWDYPGNLSRSCHELIADVIAVMSNLGYATHTVRSTDRTWFAGQWEDFYLSNTSEVLFQVKAYKNGNLHFRFKPECIRALNVRVGRLLKWVRSVEDVIAEMDYTVEEARKYFNHVPYIQASNVRLLQAPEKGESD